MTQTAEWYFGHPLERRYHDPLPIGSRCLPLAPDLLDRAIYAVEKRSAQERARESQRKEREQGEHPKDGSRQSEVRSPFDESMDALVPA